MNYVLWQILDFGCNSYGFNYKILSYCFQIVLVVRLGWMMTMDDFYGMVCVIGILHDSYHRVLQYFSSLKNISVI